MIDPHHYKSTISTHNEFTAIVSLWNTNPSRFTKCLGKCLRMSRIWIIDDLAYICKKKAMRYASQDFMDNMFGGYSPAKMMVRKKNRMAMEEMEHEAKEAEKCKCEGGGHG